MLVTTRLRPLLWAMLAAGATMAAAPLQASDYFTGKTVEMIVGGGPGGGYDIYARAVARHLGRHIPGQPTIVVKNMPGASSGKAAQYIASIAPKDGTSMAGIMPGAIMGPLLDERSAPLFDPTRCSTSAPPTAARGSASRSRAPRSASSRIPGRCR